MELRIIHGLLSSTIMVHHTQTSFDIALVIVVMYATDMRNELPIFAGLNFAVYSFPAIALAILVSLYVDLQPKKLTSR